MKLQIAFDLTDLDKALDIARKVEPYSDIIEIGTLLIYKHGDFAVKKFKETFNNKTLLVDAKISNRAKDSITLFAQAGADWITILAGSGRNFIHNASSIAHELGKKVILDLSDASSLGQSALEAKSLGVDALLFNKSPNLDESSTFLDNWQMVKGNTQLPIFVCSNITRENINDIFSIGAETIIIGNSIVNSINPDQEAKFFADILGKK